MENKEIEVIEPIKITSIEIVQNGKKEDNYKLVENYETEKIKGIPKPEYYKKYYREKTAIEKNPRKKMDKELSSKIIQDYYENQVRKADLMRKYNISMHILNKCLKNVEIDKEEIIVITEGLENLKISVARDFYINEETKRTIADKYDITIYKVNKNIREGYPLIKDEIIRDRENEKSEIFSKENL